MLISLGLSTLLSLEKRQEKSNEQELETSFWQEMVPIQSP